MNRLLISGICALLLVWQTGATVLEAGAAAVSLHALLTFVRCIGRRVAILECMLFIAALELLLVPAVTYWMFPASMPIESSLYLGYALPAYGAFGVGLLGFGRSRTAPAHPERLRAVSAYLQDKQSASIVLLVIGLGGYAVKNALPEAPPFLSTLPFYCLFISVLYAHYANSAFRLPVIGTALLALLGYTVEEGMFGELFFWMMLMALFITVSRPRPITTSAKAGFTMVAFTLLLLIQSVKGEYRRHTWGYQRGERSGDAALMGELIADRLSRPETLLNATHLFASFVRFNQGIMIGSAMANVPTHEPYANGEVFGSFLYPFVPRLIWPGKPQTGGFENIRRFTSLRQFENTSINLSPVGEGYVNFGYGGIAFAGLYGLLLSGVFQKVLQFSERLPSVILWLPALFIGCLTMETDILSTWGSLVNASLFIGLLFGLSKRVGISL